MRVTDIKQQVKNKSRYAIFVDGKYTLSLSIGELQDQKIKIDQQINQEDLQALTAVAAEDKLYMLVIGLLARRPRSAWEIRQYLARKKASSDVSDKILNKLSSRGLIDDASFAAAWVASRQLLKPSSRRKLMLELQQKHISKDIISEVLGDYEQSEQQALRELITKKRQTTRYKDNTKLMAYLLRQGFNYGDIKQAIADE